jgi:FkbM family methyltransferase
MNSNGTEVRRDGDALVFGKEIWRRPLERLSAVLVFKRRLPHEFHRHRVFVTPACSLRFMKFWRNPFTDNLLTAAKILIARGDTVWDVGANQGAFSLAAAVRTQDGHVLAFEPDPWIASLLRRTASLRENSEFHLEIIEAAISDTDGPGWLNINARSRAMNHLVGKSVWSGRRSTKAVVPVMTLRLDTVLANRKTQAPHLIKIDVEGSEHMLFRGATQVLETVRPAWFVEVAASSGNRPEVSGILRKFGYRIFDGHALSRGLIERQAYDWLAIPDEKIGYYEDRIEAARAERRAVSPAA